MAQAEISHALIIGSQGEGLAGAICAELVELGISAVQVGSAVEALGILRRVQVTGIGVEVSAATPGAIDAIAELRSLTGVPILALALAHDGAAIQCALAAGATDYLTAIPVPASVLGRLFGTQRTDSPDEVTGNVIRLRDLTIDLDRCRVTIGQTPVRLTPTEFRLLAVLVRHGGRVMSPRELAAEALDQRLSDAEARDLVKVYVGRLRAKLNPPDGTDSYVVSVRGFGYMFERRSGQLDEDGQPCR